MCEAAAWCQSDTFSHSKNPQPKAHAACAFLQLSAIQAVASRGVSARAISIYWHEACTFLNPTAEIRKAVQRQYRLGNRQ
jgi:hypothetical protein